MSRGIGRRIGQAVAPRVATIAPKTTSSAVMAALDAAITGVSKLPGAAMAGNAAMAAHPHRPEIAIHRLIERHIRYAGAQGFVTNIGGLVTLAAAIPANLIGLALVEMRLIAAILHVRGYDITDVRTKNAILAFMLGPDGAKALVKRKVIPAPPGDMLTQHMTDASLTRILAGEVATELVTQATATRLATTLGKRIPVLGGAVGASSDAYATWRLGRYVDRETQTRRS